MEQKAYDPSTFVKTGRKVVCIGRNYVNHIKELGNEIPKKPLLFLKPTTSYLESGGTVLIPASSNEIHYEVELGVVIGSECKNVPPEEALDYVAGYACGVDMTARDIQSAAKAKGHPWSVAKGYDTFLPISKFVPKNEISNPGDVGLWLKVDGAIQQDSKTDLMIWTVPKLISYASTIFTLEPGDLLLTGTPEGVGKVTPGQKLSAGLRGIEAADLEVAIGKQEPIKFFNV